MRRGAAWRCLGLFLLLAEGAVLCASPVGAQSRDERAVRAAYVYNLIQYVEWPSRDPSQGKELTIGFAGDAATGAVMKQLLEGRASNGRAIRVALFPSDEELEKCEVLYIADGTSGDAQKTPDKTLDKTLEKVRGRGVLTVGETDGFARGGGMVGLVNNGEHIQIAVNLEAAQSAGIRISSRVLNLATIVRPAAKGGN